MLLSKINDQSVYEKKNRPIQHWCIRFMFGFHFPPMSTVPACSSARRLPVRQPLQSSAHLASCPPPLLQSCALADADDQGRIPGCFDAQPMAARLRLPAAGIVAPGAARAEREQSRVAPRFAFLPLLASIAGSGQCAVASIPFSLPLPFPFGSFGLRRRAGKGGGTGDPFGGIKDEDSA